ncbi:ATP-binding response regulator [Chitinophaga pinensis]|uniref:histidine kinase n=1 Tax=Chitinophaga pinensis (strain ATCC 43595 / DSM 2588 / LMG 13176 / NBRC 15968 / NCIMB 11800 / UQM 2034) TaxID=485918 RepID=A0A979GQ99_CHIPD|nr:ATP-binding protein [Chitinophaga pinensis]ACU61207.1 response regulator receiver sensor signal transduction histidine kinase [Chitinophaga pinensis DSM 2588]
MELTKTVTPEFLTGGGEMGELIRSRDWSKTPLGPVEAWPQSLKTCVRIMLTSRQPMFVWWGGDLINLYNDAYRSILGGKHPAVLGSPASEVWTEIWDQVGPRAEVCMQQNVGTYDESLLLLMERNGYPEETYYTFSYSPVPGDEGGTSGIICANTDDTQRILGERQLRTLKDLGRYLAEAKDDADVYNRAVEILKENPADFPFACFYELSIQTGTLNMTAKTDELLSTDILPQELILESTIADDWQFPYVITHNRAARIEELQAKYGQLPSGCWTISPDQALVIPVMQNGQDCPFALLIVGINPHRQLDEKYTSFFQLVADQIAGSIVNVHTVEEARKRAEALLEIDRAKTAFFSNISHEFRTPLTLMLGPLEELLSQQDGVLTKQQEANVTATHRNAMRLLRLVNTLLDFSRIEADKVRAQYFPVNLSDVTTDIASTFRAAVEHAGLEFNVTCKDLSMAAYVDRDMWEKVILNLLSNAFKYTLQGSISVILEESDQHAILLVRDTGVGIPVSELPNMFERFHRVKQSKGRSFEGTGIGLSLVRELVQLHNGDISVESEEGKGSTFAVKIPLGRAHLPEEQVVENAGAGTNQTPGLSAAYVNEAMYFNRQQDSNGIDIDRIEEGEERARVLIVDDNADMRDYLQRLLEKQYYIETAANGKLALEKIATHQPELIISDVMMPEMDGIELLHHVKHNPATESLPVILVSARAGEEATIEGYDIGADDYLTKPFSAKELQARVRAQIRVSRLHRHALDILQHSAEELEKKVEARTSELLRKNSELEQFAYIASHDLQEPLRKIRTFSELLQKSLQKGNPVNNYFDKIQSSAERMTQLIKDVLDYSRLSNTEEKFVPIDLNTILQQVKGDFDLLIEQKQATIKSNTLPVVKGIPLQLQQLFTNLIGNSLKFCENQPLISIFASPLPAPEIPFYPGLQEDISYVKLEFSDNGIGFEQQFAERIFAIFQRLNERKVYAGTGIGLALCKKIVENHHGIIRANGKLNEGATFTVILPA